MKKGLLITLAFALALICSTGFSYAPVISEIPDVVIGDQEDGDANNFFIFSDALVFDDYVSDTDTTEDLLKWSFAQIGGAQPISINSLDEETADPTFLNPTNDIRSGFTTASFRNEGLSPRTGSIPYPTPSVLSDAHLVMYVSDGGLSDSIDFMVYSVDNDVDGFSTGIDPFYTELFDTQGSWNFYTAAFGAGPTSYGRYDTVNKRIILSSPGASWPTWYSWQIPYPGNDIISYTANTIYALKLKLSTDASTTIPLIRIRVQASDFVWETDLNPQCVNTDPASVPELGAPSTTPADFLLVWEPQGSTANAFIAFDEWEFGSGGTWTGDIYVDEFKIYKIPAADVTVVGEAVPDITAFNTAAPNNWTSATGVTVNPTNISYADTTSWHGVGRLVALTSAMTPGDVYRIKYGLSKSGTDRVDDPRIRVNDAQNGGYSTAITFDDTRPESTKHIESTSQDFVLYHVAKNNRGSVAPFTGFDLAIWCDAITKTAMGTTTMLLNKVEIDEVTLPPLN